MSKSIVVIGGGATGTGIAHAAAEAGYHVTLIEQGKLASGTTGHFHGMLHSGARYAVNDPAVAAACYQENQLLRSLVPQVIEDTGGLFVAHTDEESKHADVLIEACTTAGIPIHEISVQEARDREPLIARSLQRAFDVPDGTINGAHLVAYNRKAAEQAMTPATFLTNQIVTDIELKDTTVTAVHVRHAESGIAQRIPCDFVINATGVWAGRITALAGIELDMVYDKGTMIVFKEQLSTSVLNRCRPETDGDLLVPFDGHSIIGTTARVITNPDECLPSQEEIDVLLREGGIMIPTMHSAEALRTYAGVRPLIRSNVQSANEDNSRAISRGFRLIKHHNDGISNFMTITGGKVTLYRLMSQAVLEALQEYYA